MASQSRVSDFFPTVRSSSSRKSSSLSVKRLPPILSVKDSDNDTRSPDPHTSDSSITPTKKRHIAKSKTIRKKCPSPKTPLSPSLSAQEIKEKLKNCKNLSKLKEKLSSINGCADKVKQFKEMKVKCFSPVKPSYSNLSPRKILSPEKLSLSGMTVIPSPLKASHSVVTPNPSFSRKLFADDEVKVESKPVQTKPSTDVPDISSVDVPAYKKFSYLVKKNTADYSDEFDLPLPYKYQRLVETFKKIDYFAWVYYKRHETCTFEKIKQSIEQTTNRHFDENCLLRILSVPGPKWFKLSREYVKNKSHLTISPVYSSDNKCINSVTNLTEREKSYVRCLLEITRKEHLKFLSELNLQIPADKPIYRWHPMFKLDSVPDILPKKDILPPEKWSNNPNSILNYCFRKTKEAETKEEKKVDSPVKDNSGDKVKKGLLKGVSVDLLNKIRAKEAASLAKQMIRSPEIDREILMLGHLPEMIRIIHSCFIGTNIKSLSYSQLIQKIVDSYHCAISSNQAQKHIDYLLSLELAKKWIEVISVQNDRFIKINKEYSLHDLFRSIRNKISLLQTS